MTDGQEPGVGGRVYGGTRVRHGFGMRVHDLKKSGYRF